MHCATESQLTGTPEVNKIGSCKALVFANMVVSLGTLAACADTVRPSQAIGGMEGERKGETLMSDNESLEQTSAHVTRG